MFAYLIGSAIAVALGWKLLEDNQKKTTTPTTPLQNAVNAKPYTAGQKVRIPLNQLPANLIPANAAALFAQTGSRDVIVYISATFPGMVQGNIVATDGPEGEILIPDGVTLPVMVPNGIISGVVA